MGQAWASVAGIVLVLTVLPLTTLASPAAIDTQIVAIPPSVDPVGTRGGYATLVAVADVDGTLTFVNADISAHDVIAEEPGPTDNAWCARYIGGHGYCPIFASRLVGVGGQAVIEGTDQLEAGTTYAFYCSVHHWMQGTIVAI